MVVSAIILAEQLGVIRALLERRGQRIRTYDLEIACQGPTRNTTVVTNNERESRRVRRFNLNVEQFYTLADLPSSIRLRIP